MILQNGVDDIETDGRLSQFGSDFRQLENVEIIYRTDRQPRLCKRIRTHSRILAECGYQADNISLLSQVASCRSKTNREDNLLTAILLNNNESSSASQTSREQ